MRVDVPSSIRQKTVITDLRLCMHMHTITSSANKICAVPSQKSTTLAKTPLYYKQDNMREANVLQATRVLVLRVDSVDEVSKSVSSRVVFPSPCSPHTISVKSYLQQDHG